MAYFTGNVRSKILNMDTQLHVILPWDRLLEPREYPRKTLYLLHGLGDNASAWVRETRIEPMSRKYGIAVIMPEVQRGFYCDMRYGLRYFGYITDELPRICNQFFGLSQKRDDNFIAGLSMGGYGAVKCGLAFPEKYAGCASFSGVLDFEYVLSHGLETHREPELVALLGNELKIGDDDDLFKLAGKVVKLPDDKRPEVFITCGRQDFLYETNTDFTAHLDKIGMPYIYHEWDGEHEWGFWNKSVEMAMEYFFCE